MPGPPARPGRSSPCPRTATIPPTISSPPVRTRIVSTVAIGSPLFHYDGRFDAKIAVRNLFVEERGVGDEGLSVWAGSRMVRGDDIYLLDFWPLDNLNTLGGGARWDSRDGAWFGAAHLGFSRARDPFQLQTAERPAPQNRPGTVTVATLDRPRLVASFKTGHSIPLEKGLESGPGLKGILYAETHRLPSGDREVDPGVFEKLPADSGWVIGAQVGAWTGERDGFVNVFVRHARGLAAYGDLSVPYGLASDRTTQGARETLVGVSGNAEAGVVGLMIGATFRSFRDASAETYDWNKLDEGILVARPHLFLGERWGVFAEGSYQAQQRAVLDVATNRALKASLWRFAFVPYVSPAGRGGLRRPQIRLIWAVTRRDDGARSLYAADDVFARRRLEQFFGIGAEWWFNSTSYGK